MNRTREIACPRIGAPSLVYGFDLLENANTLSSIVDHVEIVVFHTESRHNIPTVEELTTLKKIQAETGLTYSVHLPASCQIASADDSTRETSLRLAIDMIHYFGRLNPVGYVLHIPLTTPTLTARPGCYVGVEDYGQYGEWSQRAGDALARIQDDTRLGQRLLVENINYSPAFLEPFWQQGLCGFCLDIGHLLLGGECVDNYLDRYIKVTTEIHLHGVVGWEEHLALNVLSREWVGRWIDLLATKAFDGIINIEVFDPQDLALSLAMLHEILDITPKARRILRRL